MDKDRVRGTIEELLGGAKQKVGELTGDTQLEIEGIIQQGKGKLENAWGKTKDAIRGANTQSEVEVDPTV